MLKKTLIILSAAIVLALPFVFEKKKDLGEWNEGDPVLVVISPHIAVIRDEFAAGFSDWHFRKFGSPVRIDWRSIGGTTEIMRYMTGEYVSAFKAYRARCGLPNRRAEAAVSGRRPQDPDSAELWDDFRKHDDPDDYGIMIDVFFGGGTYDHSSAARQGLTVPPWQPDNVPENILTDSQTGAVLIPESLGGEIWRTPYFYSAVLSGFGICSNPDRLRDIGASHQPVAWEDLTDPVYFSQIGVTDPTKSGSIAKAFEMIIHSQCRKHVLAEGWTPEQIEEFEKAVGAAGLPAGVMPDGVPAKYQKDVEQGWLDGLRLIRLIGANVRYFTDSAGKVPIDVAAGDAAAGISIDFYSRVQAEVTYDSVNNRTRLLYATPSGGSSISGDPISLLRGSRNVELARRFIEYVLSEDGQKLWNYRPGTPGGPVKSALRRLPVRRDFYPSRSNAVFNARANAHAQYTSDQLTDPAVDAYELASKFVYHPRWTGSHFSFFRNFIRAMCMDSGTELRAAWKAIIDAGGPEACPQAMELLCRMPEAPYPVTWAETLAPENRNYDTMECMRQWTVFFRETYKAAEKAAIERR